MLIRSRRLRLINERTGEVILRSAGCLFAATVCVVMVASGALPAAAVDASEGASDSASEAVADVAKLGEQTVSETVSPSDLPDSANAAVTFVNLPLSISVVTDTTEKAVSIDGLAVFPSTSEGVSTVVQPTATGARLLSVHDGPTADMTQQYRIDLEGGRNYTNSTTGQSSWSRTVCRLGGSISPGLWEQMGN